MDMSSMVSMEEDAQNSVTSKHGGWITFPFIIATMASLSLAAGGWVSNLIVYLIEEFNMGSISAAKVYNVINGCITVFPIVGAIFADSFLGCFTVIWISSLISLLGIVLLVLTAALNQLRPPQIENEKRSPSGTQCAVLYLALSLASLGIGGSRYLIGPMGANQFNKQKHQQAFFNWYIFSLYTSTVIASTAIVYVEDNVSWTLGFSLCAVANLLGLAIFMAGRSFYRLVQPQGSPFTNLATVIIAAIRKRNLVLSDKVEDYFHGSHEEDMNTLARRPTSFFKFLDHAALITREASRDSSNPNPWKQCTVKQVEDLKSLIKIVPLWTSGLFLCTALVVQLSLAIIQALAMDRRLGQSFKIPAGSMQVFILISTSITITLIDRVIFPLWEKMGPPITPLRRIGIGHVLTMLSMAVSAIVESKRLKVARSENLPNEPQSIVPMSVLWLVPQLAIAGVGEAFHFPGQLALYYQEFPESLKSTSTAVAAMFIGISYYLGNAVMDLVQRLTEWLPDNINKGRLDNVYWVCCILGVLNFIYYLICASRYKYQNV